MDLRNSEALPCALPEIGARAKVFEQIRVARESVGVPGLRLHSAIAKIRLNLGCSSRKKVIDEVVHPRWFQCDRQKV